MRFIVIYYNRILDRYVLSLLLTNGIVFSWFYVGLRLSYFGKRILMVFISLILFLHYVPFGIYFWVFFLNLLSIQLSIDFKIFIVDLNIVRILVFLLLNSNHFAVNIGQICVWKLIEKLTVFYVSVVVGKVLYFGEIIFYICHWLLFQGLLHEWILKSCYFWAWIICFCLDWLKHLFWGLFVFLLDKSPITGHSIMRPASLINIFRLFLFPRQKLICSHPNCH